MLRAISINQVISTFNSAPQVTWGRLGFERLSQDSEMGRHDKSKCSRYDGGVEKRPLFYR